MARYSHVRQGIVLVSAIAVTCDGRKIIFEMMASSNSMQSVNEKELSLFHEFAASVSHESSGTDSKSQCHRIESHALSLPSLRELRTPTIITGILDRGVGSMWSNWTREGLLQNHGETVFSSRALHHNGAGFYVLAMGIQQASLAEILDLDQPGNLFVTDAAQDLVQRMVKFDKLKFGAADRADLSFGSKGQWNQVHRHGPSLFTQVIGSKGFSMASPSVFAEPSRHVEESQKEWDHRHLRELTQADVCGPFANEELKQRLNTSFAQVSSASRNLTDVGLFCTVREGEAILIPNKWWHGTCDLSAWNAGFARFYDSEGRKSPESLVDNIRS